MSKSLKHFETMDVFISYRRSGGATVAALLYRELTQRGLRVFMDTEELEDDDYEKNIIKNIKSSSNFILLVSENVFFSDNVYLEVKTALTRKNIKIIPVFVNNNSTFGNVPEDISQIKKINAITLNHVKFKESISDLYRRVTSRVDDIVFKITEEFDCDHLEYLLNKLKIVDYKIREKTFEFIKMQIRERINNLDFSEKIEYLDSLYRSIYTEDVKNIAKSLNIDHRGTPSRVCSETIMWLKLGDAYKNSATDEDRLFLLRDAISVLFEGRNNFELIKSIFEDNNLDSPETKRSSKNYIYHLFEIIYSTEEIFNLLNLNEESIMCIAQKIFKEKTPKKRKTEMIKHISEWCEYRSK